MGRDVHFVFGGRAQKSMPVERNERVKLKFGKIEKRGQ
jgi:hypothetical protein